MLESFENAESSRDRTSDRTREATDRAREQAQIQAMNAKNALADMAFEAMEEYFPEKVRARRREDMVQAFVVGVLLGALVGFVARQKN